MPDIDSLSIRLSSSSTDATAAIQRVIDKLTLLNAALNNYTDDSKFVKGMGSLTGGLSEIARSINSIDLEKMKNLATVLDKLGGAGTKISQLNFAKPFAEVGASVQQAKSEANTFANDFVKQFGLPKEAIKSVTTEIERMFKSTNEYSFDQKLNALKDIALQYKYVSDEAKELLTLEEEIRRVISNTNIHVSKDTLSNFGDAAKQVRGQLNLKSTFTDISKGSDITALVNEMGYFVESEREALDVLLRLTTSESEFTNNAATLHEVTTYFEEIKNSVLNASNAMKQLSSDEVFMTADDDFDLFDTVDSDAAKAVEAVNNVQSAVSNLQSQMTMELQNPFEGLITGLEALKEVDLPAEKFVGISQLANSIGKFGGKNSDKAITNIPKFTKAFADMAAQLGNAPQISDNLVRLAEAMSKFSTKTSTATKTTTKFGSASKVLSQAFRGMYPHTMRAHHGFTSLAAIFGKLYANFFLLIRGARALGRAMNYSSSMTEAQNVVAVTFGKSSNVMDDFAKTAIKDFGMARLSATEFASRFQAMGSTMGITAEKVGKANAFIEERTAKNSRAYKELGTSVADMSINLTKLTADMASLYNQDYADVAQDMQAIYTGMTRPLRKYGLDLTQATLKEWALANGLDADIEKMSQAEKTMLRYQYVMTRASGAMGDFQKTADTWANAMRTVKQLLQEVARTIGEALINALRPALLAFRNFLFNFLELTQSALNALGKLLGWKQINFASASLVDDTEDYADALDDAAGAAKKLKGQLRGIDELNNLTTNDKSGGSGSGLSGLGAELTDWLDNTDPEDKDYESAIKNWYEFGQKIANAIKNGLSDIDWASIKEKGKAFGTNLASWLNGLIQPDMFFQIGSTIGNAVMTAIETISAFATNAEWDKWGASIAAGINGFFDKFEGDKAAEAINNLADGLQSMLTEAAKRIHWDEVFGDIKDFFKNINVDTIDFVFSAGAIAMVATSVGGLIASAAMANPIVIPAITFAISAGYLAGKGINELLEEALGRNLVTGENRWSEMWQDLVFSPFGDWANREAIVNREAKPEDFFNKVTIANLDYIDNLKNGDSMAEAYEKFIDYLGFNEDNGKTLWQNPSEFIARWAYGAVKDISGNDAALVEKAFEDLFDRIGLDKAILWAEDVKNKLIEGMSLDEIFLEDIFSPFWPAIEAKATEIGEWIDEKATALFDKIDDFVTDNVVDPIEGGFESITEFISKWWDESLAPWFAPEKWKELLQPIRDQFKYAFQAGANFAVGAFNKVLEGIEKMLNGAGDLFNALIDLASKILQKDLEHWGRITLPRIATPYANGGYPQVGSLFLAGEAGSEMVGTINGRTGVVSNGEITGIADAIRSTSDTEIQLLRQQNTLLQGILNKEFGISNDDIFRSVRTSAREYSNMTGSPAFS